ncbi:MAG: hypothetical protein R8G34_00435 [Paracoccaceae bacterium]|nr:hypothetical protein [Paracoccaceae bacterium]
MNLRAAFFGDVFAVLTIACRIGPVTRALMVMRWSVSIRAILQELMTALAVPEPKAGQGSSIERRCPLSAAVHGRAGSAEDVNLGGAIMVIQKAV